MVDARCLEDEEVKGGRAFIRCDAMVAPEMISGGTLMHRYRPGQQSRDFHPSKEGRGRDREKPVRVILTYMETNVQGCVRPLSLAEMGLQRYPTSVQSAPPVSTFPGSDVGAWAYFTEAGITLSQVSGKERAGITLHR
jgi:hypothetical protein